MTKYIHQLSKWPQFKWDQEKLAPLLAHIHQKQGKLIGKMETLGFKLQEEAVLETLTQDVIKSSEIEGEILDRDTVRSSIARRLGMEIAGLLPADRNIDGVVDMMLNATQKFNEPLTAERLYGWHASLFPTGYSGAHKISIGKWRNDFEGPMQVVSGDYGRQTIHYEAPPAKNLAAEMSDFLKWFEKNDNSDPLLKAAIAHLHFVTIHPFDDGNGRIARAIADMSLARSENSKQRFYSMSAQIRIERDAYYDILEETQKGALDITAWLEWFLNCLGRALDNTENMLGSILEKARFWEIYKDQSFNERQRLMINKLLNGFKGKLNSSKWAKIAKCSQDTALRDITDLLERGILLKEPGGGRSTSYILSR